MISEQIAEYWASVKFKADVSELKRAEGLLNKFVNNSKLIKSTQQQVKLGREDTANLKENVKLQRERLILDKAHGQALEMNKRFDERIRKAQEAGEIRRIRQEERFNRIAERERRAREVHEAKLNSLRGRSGRSPASNAIGGRGNLGVAWHGALAGAGILSGFGLRALNQKIQELQMLPIMLEGVTGSQQRAQSELAFTRKLGAETGITQTDMVPDYTKLLAASLKTPMEGTVQQGFANFVKYSKVMGLDQERTKLSLRALTQIANKGTLMSEEVKGQ